MILRDCPNLCVLSFCVYIGRAQALAEAVSGEAQPFENLPSFQPDSGAILANATPIGMHPNTDRIPVAEVFHLLPFLIENTPFSFEYRH